MKFVVNRSDAIGDTLLTLPMLALLKRENPESHITFICSDKVSDLMKETDLIDELIVLEQKDGFIKKFRKSNNAFKGKVDAYIYAGGSHIPSLAAKLNWVEKRVGVLAKWPAFFLLNHGQRQSRSLVEMHEAEYNLNLLNGLKIKYQSSDRDALPLSLTVTETEKNATLAEFKHFLSEQNKEYRDLIVIHPGMTGHTLNWQSRNYGRFILKMEKAFPDKFTYVISYTPSDEPYLEGIRDHIQNRIDGDLLNRVVFFNGAEKGLVFYKNFLASAKLFIGPSTGTTHIANAVGTPVVAIYSPIKVQSPMRWKPFNRSSDKLSVVVPDVVCGEQFSCAGESCPYYECMAKIEVIEVIEQAEKLLRQNGSL